MNDKSVGLIELSSVAAGFRVADTALKAGDVRLLLSRSICSGKYMVLLGGQPASIQAAVEAAVAAADGFLIDHVVLASIHPDVLTAIGRAQAPPPGGALGVIESFNVAAMIRAADAMVKSADVVLLELRLAMALGGKAFCTLSGDVASVNAAVKTGAQSLAEAGVLVDAIVLPRPHPDVYREII
ncbi:MAG TPA: BMC domain-containing protein [Lacunisphaera sp.]|nr:BMC domain-containing protein [Lacunisphaera sp.]